MALQDLLELAEKKFKSKNKESEVAFRMAKDEKPATGLIVDNPLFEFLLDRRFLAYGRFYLTYGAKSSSKTSLFYDLAKLFQANGGDVIWLETEHAADIDYAARQGVKLDDSFALIHPKSLEDALDISEQFIRNMPVVYEDGNTPVLICLDSIAGTCTDYELDQKHTVSDVTMGAHARLLSRWYREIENPLANEKCIFLALNQQREQIGGMSFGDEKPEAMLGGKAPGFHSTYQFKMARTKDLVLPDEFGAERKIGSRHKMTCKRNKLGREGNSQNVEFNLFRDGGIDWWGGLVAKLAEDYTPLVGKSGGWYTWKTPNTEVVAEGQTGVIDTDQKYREEDLAKLIKLSPQAKETIRAAFKIPGLPTDAEVQEIEKERKTARKKSKKAAEDKSL